MRKQKVGLTALALLLVALALAACGGKDNNEGAASGSPSASPSGSQSAAPENKNPVTLTFVMANTVDSTPFTKIFEAYKAKTGNSVELQALPGGDYDNMMKTRFSTGDFPDLFLMQPGSKQYVKLRAEETLYEWTGETDIWNRISESISEFQKDANGKIYGVPYGASGMMGIFYNKDVFAQAGVEPPKNYADLIEIAKKIKAAGFTPFYEGVKDGWPAQVFYFTGWVSQVDQAIGPEGVQKLNTNELKLSDIPELRDLFVKQKELKDLGLYQNNVLAGTFDELQNEMGEGKVAMAFMVADLLPQLEKKFGKDFVTNSIGFFPFPSATDDGTLMMTQPNQLMVPLEAKNAEAAKDLVRFMTSPEAVQIYYDNAPGIPIYKDATSVLYPAQETAKQYMDAGKATVNIQNRLTPTFADFAKTLQNLFIDGDVDKALKEMDTNYQKDGSAKQLEGFK